MYKMALPVIFVCHRIGAPFCTIVFPILIFFDIFCGFKMGVHDHHIFKLMAIDDIYIYTSYIILYHLIVKYTLVPKKEPLPSNIPTRFQDI